jgi:arylsulfatase A-like enzyme
MRCSWPLRWLPRLALFVAVACDSLIVIAADRPNVVLIISDDQAWTDYSFMGHPEIHTPNIDRLARDSATFTHGYVPSSLCCPSLASIITGQYPHQHRITCNDPKIPAGMSPQQFHQSAAFTDGREVMNRFLEEAPTLPRILRSQDYLSLQTGKWWQGDYRRGGFTSGMTVGQRHGDEGLQIGRKTMQPIFDFVRAARTGNKPFLVWYAPMMPHTPHNPPERLLKKYQHRASSLPVAKYWGMIEWFDETVGQLLDHLDQQGLADNTIVVYLADNGWIQSPEANLPAPKSKLSPYDGGLRTPIMVRWPGKIAPRTSTVPVLSIDVAPTILSALGQAPSKNMPGVNLLDEQAVKSRPAIFGECFTHNAVDLQKPSANLRWRWAVAGPWKLIVPDPTNEPNESIELYDLAHDPHETKNVAGADADTVNRLRALLDAWWNPATGS